MRVWVAEHGGKFPPVQEATARDRALGRWWASQRVGKVRLSANRWQAVLDTIALADGVRRELAAAARVRNLEVARRRMRTVALAASRRDVRAAGKALQGPGLLPGDVELLTFRVDNPGATRRELAVRMGISEGAFMGRLRGALDRGNRTCGSRRG